jgi:hypothetical protein
MSAGANLFGFRCLLRDRVASRNAASDKFFDLGLDPGVGTLAKAKLYGSGKLLLSDQAVEVLPRESDSAITQVGETQEHGQDEPHAFSCVRSLCGTFLRDC